ncbi:MAG: MMPL family transporter [Spirochaetaceae bacterium]|nr:MMPL family transporter [Spirochaetaceae bacterium]
MTPEDGAEGARARWVFERVVRMPRTIVFASLVLALMAATALPRLEKDTRADAFIPPADPSLAARERVREIFGLSDPIVVAIVAADGRDVFTPDTLALVEQLSNELAELPGIDGAHVTSLATESDIEGTELGMRVAPFFERAPRTQAEASAVRRAVFDYPLYLGSLVARDGRSTLVVAELDADFDAGETYSAVVERVAAIAPRAGETLHVAGEGGIAGHLGHYIDADARRMMPLVLVAIVAVLYLAHRTPRSVALPMLVVVGAVAVALGSMAAAGQPYTLITTALPVILVAIGVADGIHILGQYEREAEADPGASQSELVVRTMCGIWRPLAITSFTDAAGFGALALATAMPPLRSFGLFAALGVGTAFVFSVLTLPAALSLLPRRVRSPGPRAASPSRRSQAGPMRSALASLGRRVVARPRAVLAVGVIVAAAGLLSAAGLRVDYERVRNFRPEAPIRMADDVINQHQDGTNFLDVLIETDAPSGVLDPALLARIDAFEAFAATLPHVGGTVSVTDHLEQMAWALDAERAGARRLPETREAAAQMMLLYEMEGDGSGLEKTIDFEYQRALVRIFLDSGRYSAAAAVVEPVAEYLRTHVEGPGVATALAGRVHVDYRWMRGIEATHFASVGLALVAVLIVSAVLFRSVLAGVLTLVPVVVAILMVYAVMGWLDIWLGITTSMFAAIAIGLGVDFSVHVLDRLRELVRERGHCLEAAVAELLPTTGRELCFNFGCAGLGFGVLSTSQVPTLVEFGLLTLAAVSASFVGGLVVLPALVCWLRPAFVVGRGPGRTATSGWPLERHGTREEATGEAAQELAA